MERELVIQRSRGLLHIRVLVRQLRQGPGPALKASSSLRNTGQSGFCALGVATLGTALLQSRRRDHKRFRTTTACASDNTLLPTTIPDELTVSEIRRHEKMSNFSACRQGGSLCYSWVHTRGRIDKDSTDGGQDLFVMREGEFPQVALSGAASLSSASWNPDGNHFVVQNGKSLFFGDISLNTRSWLTLPTDENFEGQVVWAREDVILFATSGGAPKRARLYAIRPPKPASNWSDENSIVGRILLFTAEYGGSLLSWDHSPTGELAVVVHRCANAWLAEVVVVSCPGVSPESLPPRTIAVDGRVEYCKPQVAFLADGRILARLNLVGDLKTSSEIDMANPPHVIHGLWTITVCGQHEEEVIEAVSACAGSTHGNYDVCSGSYAGGHGVNEGFVLDRERTRVAIAARAQSLETVADELWTVDFTKPHNALDQGSAKVQTLSGKGCHVPVFLDGDELVYHFRSPTEWGDLWSASPLDSAKSSKRLTRTMPHSLQRKLVTPTEVAIPNAEGRQIHALMYFPTEASSSRVQSLVWIHGGPMTVMSFDYNPLLSWLANLGYVVCVPNFRGSTGFGVEHMDAVLADGCGSADLSDCCACAEYLKSMTDPHVDTSRGVAVAGHSWGGYLALMAMVTASPETFSCGIAGAGISDWFQQQRFTEVRYYDYAIMGGWVYEPSVKERARRASPLTHASNLSAPLLVLHGEGDIDVPFVQIGLFVDAAKKSKRSGAEVTLVTYPGEGHGISGTAAQKDFLQKIEKFLRINLKPWDFTDNPHGELTTY